MAGADKEWKLNGEVSEVCFINSVGASNLRGSRCLKDRGEEELITIKDNLYIYITLRREVSNSVVV